MKRLRREIALVIVAVLAFLGSAGSARAQESTEEPVLLAADRLTYDEEGDTVTATGNVELGYGERILVADRLTWDRPRDLITADGNVALVEADGDVLFAEHVELSGDLRRGAVRSIRLLLADRTRIAATGARRFGDGTTEMSKAVFSPCETCQDDPERAPLWQVKAVRVVHDEVDKEIQYTDAIFEVFGLPVAWVPFFSHPDPTVDRKTGFLSPGFGSSTFLGTTFELPYFFNIAPNRDATFTPIITTEQGVILTGEYRQLTERGSIDAFASVTDPPNNEDQITGKTIRGHVDFRGLQEFGDHWRTGLRAQRASDPTFLTRYDFRRGENTLETRLFAERGDLNSFGEISAFAFQTLDRQEDQDTVPLVSPLADFRWVSRQPILDGRLSFDANTMVLSRPDGADSRRLSLQGGWLRTLETPIGSLFTIDASLRGDLYNVDEVPDPDAPGRELDGTVGRFVPQIAIDWQHPMVRHGEHFSQIIEPLAQFVAAPDDINDDEIPNEDSVDFELDDTNIFSADRFTGLDRVEPGIRFNYGLRAGIYGAEGPLATVLLGQSYRLDTSDVFEPGTGLSENFSDYIARVELNPSRLLDLSYRGRFDADTLALRRSTVGMAAGPPRLKLRVNYVSINQEPTAATPVDIEELDLFGLVGISDNWSLTGQYRRDLSADGGALFFGGGLIYRDECTLIRAQFRRDFFRDIDIEPETRFTIQVQLKHLGQ